MSEETVAMPVIRNGASDYVLHANYSAPVHQSATQGGAEYSEHRFSSNNLFPALNEYSKVNATDIGEFSSLSFKQQGIASLRLVEASGSFKNVLGHYQVDNRGTIHNVEIAFNNTRSKQGEETHQFGIHAGNHVHLFVVANGFSLNKEFSNTKIEQGDFSFLYKFGEEGERLAKITDATDDITLVYIQEGSEPIEIRGPVYHTTNDGIQEDVNPDSHKHAVSGFIEGEDDSVLRVGFEDFPGLGDADYNDVVIDLKVVYSAASSHKFSASETLYGEEDSIPLYDDKDIRRDSMHGTDGFDPSLDNGFDSNLNLVLNDEEDVINVDDVLVFDSADDIVVSYLDFPENGNTPQSQDDNITGIEAITAGVDYGLPDLEILIETTV